MSGREEPDDDGRAIVFCMIPRDLARKLHEPLRRHFAADGSVEVVVERRDAERREVADRRTVVAPAPSAERRRLQARRIAERRAMQVPVPASELPRRARAHAERLTFVERIEPSGKQAEDVDSARLVAQAQAGDEDAFARLYERYFDRVYNYMRAVFSGAHDAEDATQQIFLRVLEALPQYAGRQIFRAWLFTIVRNYAIDEVRRRGRVDLVEPEQLQEREADASTHDGEELPILDWVSDRDLVLLLNRLPLPQRQVILLRYMFDLSNIQIAKIMDRSPNEVAVLHYRALGYVRKRLAAVGRTSSRARRVPVRRRVPQSAVLRRRRFVLR